MKKFKKSTFLHFYIFTEIWFLNVLIINCKMEKYYIKIIIYYIIIYYNIIYNNFNIIFLHLTIYYKYIQKPNLCKNVKM